MSAQIITAFVFGVAFVIALIVLAIAFPRPTSFQYTVFRIVLSLAAAGTAAMIPGFITLDISAENALLLRAGGAIAVFAVVFFFNPAQLAVQSESQEQVKSDPEHVNPKSRESAPLDTETQSGFKGIIEFRIIASEG